MPAALIEAAVAAARREQTPGRRSRPAPARPALVVVAERAAWVRVYQENGTVVFESILEKGQTYSPPEGIEAPLIWAGNSGSVYVRVGDELHGPLGSGTKATRDVRAGAEGDRRALRRGRARCPR